jgi:hypothetical protein
MKTTIFVYLFLVAAAMPAMAQNVVKTCSTTISDPEGTKTVPTKIEVQRNQKSYDAKVTQIVDGQAGSYEDSAEISEYQVRDGLFASADPDGLNLAEKLIVQAMDLEGSPIFQNRLKTGLNLRDVKSAKVYLIGKMGNMGGSAIVEAKDRSGADLGSFLGGFLVFPCTK